MTAFVIIVNCTARHRRALCPFSTKEITMEMDAHMADYYRARAIQRYLRKYLAKVTRNIKI